MKTRIKRHQFCFTQKTHDLLMAIRNETESTYTEIVKEALEIFAKQRGISVSVKKVEQEYGG